MSDNYSILPLIGIVALIMLGFAAFFVSFLLAPVAVLAVFYLFLFLRERSRSRGGGEAVSPETAERIQREREARELEMEREREGVPVEELLASARRRGEPEDGADPRGQDEPGP
jgi:hypothetical protein